MTDRELEQKIAASYRNIAPDILDSVLADCDAQKGKILPMQKKKNKSIVKYLGGLAAALVLVAGGLGFYQSNRSVASTVMLDVNPGIGISVNKKEKVLDVKPYNKDAETVIGTMDFSGSSLDVAVNALIGSMLRNGYISEDANSVLISVDSRDPAAGQAMQTRLMNEVSGILAGEKLSGAVLGQTVEEDAELQKLAEQYGITLGKAKLIDQIIRQNTLYTFADLVSLSINELNLISESGTTKLENIDSIGKASSSAYIGEESAKEAAFRKAEIDPAGAMHIRCELDWERGIMVYEVDFDADGYEYEAEVNALTGEVIRLDREKDDDYFFTPSGQSGTSTQGNTSGQSGTSTQSGTSAQGNTSSQGDTSTQGGSSGNGFIGEAAAKAAAYLHAGVAESDVLYCTCEPELKRGVRLYEIEFAAGGYEYDYDINAVTGDVIRFSRERDDDYRAPAEGTTGDIGEAAAKAAALQHAGVSSIWDYECEREYKRGKDVYEISFNAGGYEYEYWIDAADGTVVHSEKERD